MIRLHTFLLSLGVLATISGAAPAADGTFTLGDHTFKGPADFPTEKREELKVAFQYAIYHCIEYKWAEHNIGLVEFSHASGPPPGLKTPVRTGLKHPLFGSSTGSGSGDIKDYGGTPARYERSRDVLAGELVRHYRFVIRFKPNPTWKDGSPIQGVTEEHRGIVYVAYDASGAVRAVFDYTSEEECPSCPAIRNDRDKLKFNLAMAICS